MGMFSQVSEDTFDQLQLEAGMLLNTFDPASPAKPADSAIICATTGGITPSCVPTYTDFGEDIDNCPNNTKELKKITGWECKLGFTALNITAAIIKMALGAADAETTYRLTSDTSLVTGKTYYSKSGTSPNYTYTAVQSPSASSLSSYYEVAGGAVTPRSEIKDADFTDLWWVGDRSDGGMVAIKLENALSNSGFSLTTTKAGKGQLACEMLGHVSISDTDDIPMKFYVAEG